MFRYVNKRKVASKDRIYCHAWPPIHRGTFRQCPGSLITLAPPRNSSRAEDQRGVTQEFRVRDGVTVLNLAVEGNVAKESAGLVTVRLDAESAAPGVGDICRREKRCAKAPLRLARAERKEAPRAEDVPGGGSAGVFVAGEVVRAVQLIQHTMHPVLGAIAAACGREHVEEIVHWLT